MVSSAANILLMDKDIMRPSGGAAAGSTRIQSPTREPILRIPPFPGAKVLRFGTAAPVPAADFDLGAEMRRLRVGGTYWAAQPELPSDYILVRSPDLLEEAREIAAGKPLLLWLQQAAPVEDTSGALVIRGDCDPWHMLSSAAACLADAEDEVSLIAVLLERPLYCRDCVTGAVNHVQLDPDELAAEAMSRCSFENPFTHEAMTPRQLLDLCGFWRQLIDSNRGIAGGLGIAFWKQDHVAPLLWDGSQPFRFFRSTSEARGAAPLAVWRSKVSAQALQGCQQPETLIEVEDGFLRSRGLGADCIPPLSITFDRLGPHFDPSKPSELEIILQEGRFDEALVARARKLRQLIVDSGLGKYEQGAEFLQRPSGKRVHILVAGQVEDDRAVQVGGCGLVSNLELLKRVREHAPDAHIIYKPHPDVLAGHRRGAVPDRLCLQFADQIVGDEHAIGSLIAMVDEVHVNTSLAGFEALLRGKQVTTYGVPFYAGWGMTRDLGPVPERRTATRTLDELVAATLLVYPRYLDPITGLPCPAEVIVSRLTADVPDDPGLLVGIRRLQGRLMRRLRSLVQ